MSFIKIDDIARFAGYSKSTVSKVINNYPGIPEKTREKILKVIKKYEFQPNSQARNLAGKKDKVIGVFVFDKNGLNGPFFQGIISVLTEKAEDKNLKVLLSVAKNKNHKLKIKKLIDNGTIQGAIIIGATLEEPELESLIENEYKLVIFDYKNEHKNKNIFLINSNNYNGGRLAAKTLIDQNLKRLYHLAGDENKLAGLEREEGFLDELDGHGVVYKVLKGEFQLNKAKEILSSELKKGEIPEGIFCANDEMAIGCVEALYENKIDYKEVKIIGFDNTQISTLYRPKITTISYNLEKMAEIAIEKIILLMEEKEIKENIYNGELKLYIRET